MNLKSLLSCACFASLLSSAPAATVIKILHLQSNAKIIAIWQEAAQKFESAHPGVKVEFNYLENEAFKAKLPTLLQSKDRPSAFHSWGGGVMYEQVSSGICQDITKAASEGGDVFAHTPGKVERGETGDVACDHYHRFKEDVALMADLGIQAYRFSISWSRVLPEGVGRPNSTGLDFYDRLVDELMVRGLTPFATLFHWDLPQVLQDLGGFANRDVVSWFSDYAVQTTERLGDRVKHWIMLNEPSVYACLGHALGVHAPGLADLQAFRAVTHHLNLAQGTALLALRTTNPAWRLGTTLNLHRGVPADGSEASATMAERHNDLWNNCFLGPLLSGAYPTRILPEMEPFVRSGDLETIRQTIDFLGINHYSRGYIQADSTALLGFRPVAPPVKVPRTSFDWEINPQEFRDVLLWLDDTYPCPPIYITENGAYFDDTVSVDGKVHDARRIDYLDRYIQAMQEAQAKGVDVRGYFVWSLLDNFEWACGYRPTFGLVKVDFNNLQRLPKDSYFWYRDFVGQHGI